MDKTMLSTHFALDEFTRSDVAARHGIEIVVADPSDVLTALEALCTEVLEPVRVARGPIQILSGYRPDQVNALVGGAASSQHCMGQAADIIIGGMTPLELCQFLEQSQLPYDQLIHEFGRWCHVSHNPVGPQRRQSLTAYFDKAEGMAHYVPGLHALSPITGEPV